MGESEETKVDWGAMFSKISEELHPIFHCWRKHTNGRNPKASQDTIDTIRLLVKARRGTDAMCRIMRNKLVRGYIPESIKAFIPAWQDLGNYMDRELNPEKYDSDE